MHFLTRLEYSAFKNYLGFVKSRGDVGCTLCVFERAVAALCLYADVWLDYIAFQVTTR